MVEVGIETFCGEHKEHHRAIGPCVCHHATQGVANSLDCGGIADLDNLPISDPFTSTEVLQARTDIFEFTLLENASLTGSVVCIDA